MLPASSRASVLSPDSDSPPVPQTPVCSDLLHPLNIITQLSIEILCEHLRVFTRLEILLPIQEPQRDLELSGILNNRHNLYQPPLHLLESRTVFK